MERTEKARELYTVALDNDASCVEALYNLGLCNKKLGLYEEALEIFFKLQTIVRNHAQVLYQVITNTFGNELGKRVVHLIIVS